MSDKDLLLALVDAAANLDAAVTDLEKAVDELNGRLAALVKARKMAEIDKANRTPRRVFDPEVMRILAGFRS